MPWWTRKTARIPPRWLLPPSHLPSFVSHSDGSVISSDVRGVMRAKSHLSGFPDLTVLFTNPGVFADVALHPCIRMARFEKERCLSFVPPDGKFEVSRPRPLLSSDATGSPPLDLHVPIMAFVIVPPTTVPDSS